MIELNALRAGLQQINLRLNDRHAVQGPAAITQTAAEFERRYGEGRPPDPELILRSLRKFLETGTLSTFAEVKNACFGMLQEVGGSSIVGQPALFRTLLETVNRLEADRRKLLRCCHGLLGAYLNWDQPAEEQDRDRWNLLRTHLQRWVPTLIAVPHAPNWIKLLGDHRNLLSTDPTSVYGPKLLAGDRDKFEQMCRGLEIRDSSWVMRRAVLSTVEAGCDTPDPQFNAHLETLMSLVQKHQGLLVDGSTVLLERYARKSTRSEHPGLRSLALETFGNPLVVANRPRWTGVSNSAREMVSDWLKEFLIDRYFELLTHDGRTDKRRPKFWLSYRDSIQGMWFVLGTNARNSFNADFTKLRETMGDQCLALEGATASNNAFIMRLGRLYVVEFGEKGHATQVFDADRLPFNLSQRSLVLKADLKNPKRIDRLVHMDGHERWETKFADTLLRLARLRPDPPRPRPHGSDGTLLASPMPQPQHTAHASVSTAFRGEVERNFRAYCARRGLALEDLRATGGPLIVHAGLGTSSVNAEMSSHGFIYDAERRRWTRQ